MSGAGRPPTGLLLVRGALDPTLRWAGGGLATVGVAPVEDGWTAVVPTMGHSAVHEPYDDAVTLLLNRPLPARLRPAIGFAVVGGQALIAVNPPRWRAVRRWLAWQPGTGLVRPGGLAVARLADLVRVAGVTDPAAVAAVADVVHDPRGNARTVLRDLVTALGLPGGDLFDGTTQPTDLPQGREVEPSAATVSGFERMVHEDTSWRDEMEGKR